MITDRTSLIEYCKRKLGAPVINLELDDNQIQDRVDDAITFYQDIHYDGTEKTWLKHRVQGTVITVSSAALFEVGEVIKFSSGADATVSLKDATTITVKQIEGTLPEVGDTVEGIRSGAFDTITSIALGDADKGYIELPDTIIGVIRVLPFKNSLSNRNYMDYAFDPKYQIQVTELHSIANSNITYYSQLRQHLALLDYELRPLDSVRFNRHTDRVYIDMNWDVLAVGEYLVFECFTVVNPDTFPEMYADRLFRKYATALIKQQWGNNLKKFEGVQMIGGVTLNGQQIFNEATEEVQQIEEQIRSGFELPPIGFLG